MTLSLSLHRLIVRRQLPGAETPINMMNGVASEMISDPRRSSFEVRFVFLAVQSGKVSRQFLDADCPQFCFYVLPKKKRVDSYFV